MRFNCFLAAARYSTVLFLACALPIRKHASFEVHLAFPYFSSTGSSDARGLLQSRRATGTEWKYSPLACYKCVLSSITCCNPRYHASTLHSVKTAIISRSCAERLMFPGSSLSSKVDGSSELGSSETVRCRYGGAFVYARRRKSSSAGQQHPFVLQVMKKLVIACILTFLFCVFELAGGFLAHRCVLIRNQLIR